MFHLRKWYLDMVTDKGVAFVGYAGHLAWLGCGIPLCGVQHMSMLISTPEKTQERPAGALLVWPQQDRDILHWTAPHLVGTWRRQADAISAVLLDSAAGQIRWTCHMPIARAKVQLDDGVCLEGMGYVEELEMTVKPWKLPFDTLRWGRFIGLGTSVVWIDWQGGLEGRWVYLDGKAVAGGRVSDEQVAWDGGSLELCQERILREGWVADAALPKMRWLGRFLPGGLGRATEHKWLSKGILRQSGIADVTGWCVQEVVQWR